MTGDGIAPPAIDVHATVMSAFERGTVNGVRQERKRIREAMLAVWPVCYQPGCNRFVTWGQPHCDSHGTAGSTLPNAALARALNAALEEPA